MKMKRLTDDAKGDLAFCLMTFLLQAIGNFLPSLSDCRFLSERESKLREFPDLTQ